MYKKLRLVFSLVDTVLHKLPGGGDEISLWLSKSLLHGASAIGNEGFEDVVQVFLVSGVQLTLSANFVEKASVASLQMGNEFAFEFGDLGGDHSVKVAPDTCENDANLFLSHHRDLHKSIITNCFCLRSSVS
jgi:hypothetical protein